MKASIALQVLPLSQGIDRIAVIDKVIAYLQAQEVTGQGADNVFANVKINIGEILSIDEKLEKYNETAY